MAGTSGGQLIRIVVAVAGLAAAIIVSGQMESAKSSLPESFSDSDLQFQGKRLKGYALGFEGLLADWYWIRSLQYVGDKLLNNPREDFNFDDMRELDPRLLYPFLDNATSLDPKFLPAFSYGAIVLPAIDPQLAISLTEKGIAENPEHWRLYQYLGYIHWRNKDFEKAAEAYERGSKIKGSGEFMTLMAAAMRTSGGDRAVARSMYQQMLADSDSDQGRKNLEQRLQELDSLDEQDAINAKLSAYKESFGRCPNSLSVILESLQSVDLPGGRDFRIDGSSRLVDPSGAPYELDTDACKVELGTRLRSQNH